MRSDGSKLPNVFASGGAAVGVSGTGVDGYLSGNGLLTAVTLPSGWLLRWRTSEGIIKSKGAPGYRGT